jgi:hypothetical protein
VGRDPGGMARSLHMIAGVDLQLLFPPARRRSLLRRVFVSIVLLGHSCGKPDPDTCIPPGPTCEPRPDPGSDAPAHTGGSRGNGGSGGSGSSDSRRPVDARPRDASGSRDSAGSIDTSSSDGFTGPRRPVDGALVNELTIDRWTPILLENAPSPRLGGAAVWTGQEMIVWGGQAPTGVQVPLATGARYNPTANTWTAMATLRAPIARYGHSAVWTGQEMIVWGGGNGNGTLLDSGARYNPQTDKWTTMSLEGAPRGRTYSVAAWGGTHMLIWGGETENRGSGEPRRYDPTTDTWSAVSSTDLPPSAVGTRALWTGSEILLMGGSRLPLGRGLAGHTSSRGNMLLIACPSCWRPGRLRQRLHAAR